MWIRTDVIVLLTLTLVALAGGCAKSTSRRVHVRFADLLHGHTSVVEGSTAHYPSVSLAGESRVVLAESPPGALPLLTRQHASVQIEVPAGGRLEVGFGVSTAADGAVAAPVDFTLRLHSGDRAETVMQRTVSPASGDLGAWHDEVVDLDGWVGSTTFEFSTSSAVSGLDPATGLVAARAHFSAPVLTAPIGRDPRYNLILISLDTLRADRLGIYGYGKPTSPNIDRIFGKVGLVVDRAYTNGVDTLQGHLECRSTIA